MSEKDNRAAMCLHFCRKYSLPDGMTDFMRGETYSELEADAQKLAGEGKPDPARVTSALYLCRSLGLPDETADQIEGSSFAEMKASAQKLVNGAEDPSDDPSSGASGDPEDNDNGFVLRLEAPAAIDEEQAMKAFEKVLGETLGY